MSEFACNTRQTKAYIEHCLNNNLVPFIQSSPGCGKSALVHQIADEAGFELIDYRLATADPTDIQGLPHFEHEIYEYVDDSEVKTHERSVAKFVPFNFFPIEGTKLPKGKKGWLLFLDEFNQAPRSVQAAAYQLVLDHQVGQYKLDSRCKIVCAGNLSTDNAITNNLSTAMQSRLIHIEMNVSKDCWLEDVALAQKYDERIIAFINMYPNYLMDFDPDHEDKTFACPRTWEFTNKLITGVEDLSSMHFLLAGTITAGVATQFVTFSKIYKDMLTIDQVVKNPAGVTLSKDKALQYALITSLVLRTDKKNLEQVSIFIDRLNRDFKVLFYKMFLKLHPELIQHKAIASTLDSLYKFIYAKD